LHGFPSSSHMFRDLIPALADRFHVIAPDYPGYGQSAAPDHKDFTYTFDRIAELIDGLLAHLGVERFALYAMDYGAPISWRLALKRPKDVSALIVQNGNAYDEGLKAFWDPIKKYWTSGSAEDRAALKGMLSLEGTMWQYQNGTKDKSRISPDNWMVDQPLLDRPQSTDIQLDLFYDYRTNVALYPTIQQWFRDAQPPTLIVWGQNDEIFPADGAHPYTRDLKRAELHLMDTGHFLLEEKAAEAIPLMREFLIREVP
jgi:pimeloyl-ACP methyl ester carboxylesterase